MKNFIFKSLPCLIAVFTLSIFTSEKTFGQEFDIRGTMLTINFGGGKSLDRIPDSTWYQRPARKMGFITPFDDATSPILREAKASGKHFPSAIFKGKLTSNPGSVEYLQITLTDVLVSSYAFSNSSTAIGLQVDQFSLTYQKIEWVWIVNGKSKTISAAEGEKLLTKLTW